MYERMKKIDYFWITIALVILCFVALPSAALAEELTGSLTVCYTYRDGNTTVPIDGAVFSIYRIADYDGGLNIKTGWGDINISGMTAEDVEKLSEKLSGKVTEPLISGITGEDGTVSFPDLENGVFLVKQTGRTGSSRDYEIAVPFLVTITSAEGDDLICYPKTNPIKRVNPATGDDLKLKNELMVFFAGAVLLAGLSIVFRAKGGDDRC